MESYTLQQPKYTDTDGQEYEYSPPSSICSIRRYEIARCMRERMTAAIDLMDTPEGFELWKRERFSFWATLAQSIPTQFK